MRFVVASVQYLPPSARWSSLFQQARLTLKTKFLRTCARPGKDSYLDPALTATVTALVGNPSSSVATFIPLELLETLNSPVFPAPAADAGVAYERFKATLRFAAERQLPAVRRMVDIFFFFVSPSLPSVGLMWCCPKNQERAKRTNPGFRIRQSGRGRAMGQSVQATTTSCAYVCYSDRSTMRLNPYRFPCRLFPSFDQKTPFGTILFVISQYDTTDCLPATDYYVIRYCYVYTLAFHRGCESEKGTAEQERVGKDSHPPFPSTDSVCMSTRIAAHDR